MCNAKKRCCCRALVGRALLREPEPDAEPEATADTYPIYTAT